MNLFLRKQSLQTRLTFILWALLGALPLACRAQTARQYVEMACNNEIKQQTSPSLWESTSLRRAAGHVYKDRTIETVDGDVDQLLSVDGHDPAGADKSKNDKVLQRLLNSDQQRADKHKSTLTENKDAATLLHAIPHMFVFQDLGMRDGIESIGFRPDPAYQAESLEQRAIHQMQGTIFVARNGMRLTAIDAVVSEDVQFGYGLLGTLNQGGTYKLQRVEVAPGVWKTSETAVHMSGRVALFKDLTKQQDESKSAWKQVPPRTSILDALRILGVKP